MIDVLILLGVYLLISLVMYRLLFSTKHLAIIVKLGLMVLSLFWPLFVIFLMIATIYSILFGDEGW